MLSELLRQISGKFMKCAPNVKYPENFTTLLVTELSTNLALARVTGTNLTIEAEFGVVVYVVKQG